MAVLSDVLNIDNRITCNEKEVAKVAKPADMEPKCLNKHNADQAMPKWKWRIKHCKTIWAELLQQTDHCSTYGQWWPRIIYAVSSEIDSSSKVSTKRAATSKVFSDESHACCWRIKEPPKRDKVFKGDRFSKPRENFDELHPIDCFNIFWTDNIPNLLIEQTNLYSTQVSMAQQFQQPPCFDGHHKTSFLLCVLGSWGWLCKDWMI